MCNQKLFNENLTTVKENAAMKKSVKAIKPIKNNKEVFDMKGQVNEIKTIKNNKEVFDMKGQVKAIKPIKNNKEASDMNTKKTELSKLTKNELRTLLENAGVVLTNSVFKATKKAILIDSLLSKEEPKKATKAVTAETATVTAETVTAETATAETAKAETAKAETATAETAKVTTPKAATTEGMKEGVKPIIPNPLNSAKPDILVATKEQEERAVENLTLAIGGSSIRDFGSTLKIDAYSITKHDIAVNEKLNRIVKDMGKRIIVAYRMGFRTFYVDGLQDISMLFWRSLVSAKAIYKDINIIVRTPFADPEKMWTDYVPCSFLGCPAVAETISQKNIHRILVFSKDYKGYGIFPVSRNMVTDFTTNSLVPVKNCVDFTSVPVFSDKIKTFIHDCFISLFSKYSYRELMKSSTLKPMPAQETEKSFYKAQVDGMKQMVIDANATFVYDLGEKRGPLHQQMSFAVSGVKNYNKKFGHVDMNTLI